MSHTYERLEVTMQRYDSALEHLDEVGAWVAHLFDRVGAVDDRRRMLDDALAARLERIEARLAAARAAGNCGCQSPTRQERRTHFAV